jgi:hypothetical protein
MPLSVNWYDDEHSIIVVTITNDMTWNDYHDAIGWIVSEASQVAHRVDLIFHDNVGMPKGNPLPHLKRGSARIIDQPNICLTIIAGSQGYSGFVRMILETLAKAYMRMPGKDRALVFLRDLSEALEHIKKDRIRSAAES